MASSGQDACGEGEGEGEGQEPAAVGSAHLLDFSDEILLHILSHVPSTDLVLNVRLTCRKLATLCLDKSLTHTVLLRKDYEASEDKVKRLVTAIGREVRELDLTGCYWLSGAAVERVGRCRALVRVGLSGCPLSAARLSRVLPALPQLRALALDVGPGFDAAQLSAECRAALGRVRELKQTLLAPSYGVVPCCGRLEKLLLYLELPDRARDGGAALSGQQLVGQSTVPRYQHLRVFYARLAPGLTNQEVARLFLAALSHRTPPHLRAFVLAAPGGLAESGAGRQLLEGMARHVALDALQLPRSWLGAASPAAAASSAASPAAGPPPPPPPQPRLGRPEHLSLRRCALPGGLLLRRLLQAGRDLRALASLDLSGCAHCLAPDALAGRADDDIDSGVLEALVAACAGLRHLNLSAAHHHSAPGDARHLCRLLGRLRRLRSLALPVCALAEPPAPAPPPGPGPGPAPAPPPAPLLRAPGKRVRTGVPAEPRPDAVAGSAFAALLRALPGLERLELIGSNFSSAMPRLEPAIRNALPPCARAHAVGDAEVAAVGQLAFLRHLTLAQLPGVLTGAGLLAVALRCQQLQSLSLANLGLAGKVVYAGALADALRHCQRLRDLRLEQPYFSANAQFFQALSQCPALQRLCLVSRSGTLQPDAVLAFVARCVGLVACHLFTGESLTTCRSLQQSLRSFQAERPALNVVIFPLLHEGLTDVIRDVPMVHLDEITLFKSKVAEEPPNLWW